VVELISDAAKVEVAARPENPHVGDRAFTHLSEQEHAIVEAGVKPRD
jgi:hypothetical protein